LDGGDHVILVGRVERYSRFQGEPLLFAQGRYAIADDHPDLSEVKDTANVTPLPFETHAASLVRLANYATHRLTARLESAYQNHGFERVPARLGGWLRTEPRSLEDLVMHTYLGRQVVLDALQEMSL